MSFKNKVEIMPLKKQNPIESADGWLTKLNGKRVCSMQKENDFRWKIWAARGINEEHRNRINLNADSIKE